MLDEFTSLGKIEVLETTLAYMRGYGLKAYIIVQDLKQLQNAYGRHESIISNCHIRTAFAPNKIETAEVLSKMSGKTTIISEKQSVSKNTFAINANVSTSIQEVGRPLLTADECMQLPGAVKSRFDEKKVVKGGDMLIFPAGFKPIYGKQYLYFQDKEMLKKSQIKIESEVKAKPLPEESSEPMEDKQKTMSQLLLKGVKNT
jgi:type IV secretion system protein VirD4